MFIEGWYPETFNDYFSSKHFYIKDQLQNFLINAEKP